MKIKHLLLAVASLGSLFTAGTELSGYGCCQNSVACSADGKNWWWYLMGQLGPVMADLGNNSCQVPSPRTTSARCRNAAPSGRSARRRNAERSQFSQAVELAGAAGGDVDRAGRRDW